MTYMYAYADIACDGFGLLTSASSHRLKSLAAVASCIAAVDVAPLRSLSAQGPLGVDASIGNGPGNP